MAFLEVQNIAIKGISVSVPAQKISNEDYPGFSETEKKTFIKTTGIRERRVAPAGLTASDLCFSATEKIQNELNWDSSEIRVLVFVTQTPDYQIPATSNILQHRLGLSKNCIAIDINLGCSGYVYGLVVASSLLSLTKGKALLLAGDVSTACLSAEDKSTAPIFSDAGSATALAFDEKAQPIKATLCSDGSGADAIIIPDGGMRSPFSFDSLEFKEIENGIKRNRLNLEMKGVDVFNFSLREVPPNIRDLLEYAEFPQEEVDFFVFHQANKLMNESIRRKLSIPPEKVPYSLGKYGNTSSATIPVTIASEMREVVEKKPLSIVISGFGVGLSWGSALLQCTPFKCPEIIEI